ncbi:MATE family efflux transporter [Thioclava sp. FR2]|uniref:MATE family efflux transporter n=1 Tax=Thioclava sp. FR2 TaxID=3445780 RepID=UPI003EBBB54D
MTAVTNRRIWAISWPIILSNASIPLLGAVDTAVVGQMGAAAPIGAVGLGAIILSSIYWIFGFLRMGTTGLAAQAHGAGNESERAAILFRALLIGLGAGALIILAQVIIIWGAFLLAPASDTVETLAREYLSIRIWGAPATIALYAVNGWLIAVERTRSILFLQLSISGLNAFLDVVFVLGLGGGVAGVASATLIAEWTGLGIGLWLCRDAIIGLWTQAIQRISDADALRRMLAVNGGIMLRTVLLQAAFTSFLFLSAGQGDEELAANQVLMQFLSIMSYALDGFAFSAETLVGQTVGARQRSELERATQLSMRWGLGGSVLLAGVFWLGGGAIIDVMTTAPDVRSLAREFLPWVVLAPILGIISWIYDGIFIGATASRAMVLCMAISVAVYGLSLFVLLPMAGNHGLWAALMLLFVLRAATAHAFWPGIKRDLRI